MVIKKCPACDNSDTKIVFHPNKYAKEQFILLSNLEYKGIMNNWLNNLDLKIRKCNNCYHIWHNTQPDLKYLKKMYITKGEFQKELYKKNIKKKHDFNSINFKYKLNYLKSIYNLAKNKMKKDDLTLLDFGSGLGLFSYAAKTVGFNVIAYEPNFTKTNSELYKNIKVYDDFNKLKNYFFDVIIIEQVLEHTKDPFDTLKDILSVSKKGSIITISTPNARKENLEKVLKTFPFVSQKNDKHVLSPYEHLQGFNNKSLGILLSRLDLKKIKFYECLRFFPVRALKFILSFFIKEYKSTNFIVTKND